MLTMDALMEVAMATLTAEQAMRLHRPTRKQQRQVVQLAREMLGDATKKLDDALGQPRFSGRDLEVELGGSGQKR